MKQYLLPLLALIAMSRAALCCPLSDRIPDYNCDQKLDLTFIGDSVVSGIGDTHNNNSGGYPLRVGQRVKGAKIHNLGVAGLHASQLVIQMTQAFRQNSRYPELRTGILAADIVILDVGRNDRWEFGPPIATYRNLQRIAKLIKQGAKKERGVSPLVVTAVLMLPNRGSQGPWVKELNGYILKGNTIKTPADLRFDLASKRYLTDGIHPSPDGYAALAETVVRYLTKALPPKMRNLRPDKDADGVYDLFETLRFGTDPINPDTDSDGKTDGQELFTSNTDPLVPN